MTKIIISFSLADYEILVAHTIGVPNLRQPYIASHYNVLKVQIFLR